jgi:hypothetical protein
MILLGLVLPNLLLSGAASAEQMFSVDLGYIDTDSESFGQGFTYGVGVTEGEGEFGFGITAMRLSNSEPVVIEGRDAQGKPITVDLEETVNDFMMSFLGTWHLNEPIRVNHFILGVGPQVHFLSSTRENRSIKESARDYRLGLTGFFRYYRRIEMFGRTSLAFSASMSHVMSVASRTDQYEPPTHGWNYASITLGMAFPF